MKLWILYVNKLEKTSVTPKQMTDEAKKNGTQARLLYYENLIIKQTPEGEELYYRGKIVKTLPNMILFRGYDEKLIEYFTKQGIAIVNSPKCMSTCKNKFKTHELLKELNIQQPETFLVKTRTTFNSIKKQVGLPFILKDNFGKEGKDVYLVHNKEEFLFAKSQNDNLIAQKYIKRSKGVDIRTYIIGNKVYSIRRRNITGGFKTNLDGGTIRAEKMRLTFWQKRLVLKIARLLDIEIGSVDFLIDGRTLMFLEANTSAGFKSFLKMGVNINKIMFKHIAKNYNNKFETEGVKVNSLLEKESSKKA